MAKLSVFLLAAPMAWLGLSCLAPECAVAQSDNAAVASRYGRTAVQPQVRATEVAPATNTAPQALALAPRSPDDNELNRAIDATLAKFAPANAGNRQATAALADAAAQVQRNPSAFLNADGTANQAALAALVTQKFAGAGALTIPSPGASDGADATGNLSSLGDGDIMALAFIVMMEAAKSAQEDLKTIMEGVNAINKKKEGWRRISDSVSQLAAKCAGVETGCTASSADQRTIDNLLARKGEGRVDGLVAGKDIDSAKETIKNKLDSLSEMGETESLRLQMAMDRLSKLMSTLSNVLKKSSDTASDITKNIK